jgi:hypothetical protein
MTSNQEDKYRQVTMGLEHAYRQPPNRVYVEGDTIIYTLYFSDIARACRIVEGMLARIEEHEQQRIAGA